MSNYFKGKASNILNVPMLVLAAFIIGCGIFGLMANLNEGKYFFVVGLVGLLLKKGVMVDVNSKRLKKYWGLLGIKFGNWEPLPQSFILTLTKSSQTKEYNLPYGGAQYFAKTTDYKLGIGVNGKIKTVISKGAYNTVLEDGSILAERLSVKLLDTIKK